MTTISDIILETTTGTGTGNLTLTNVTGFRPFSDQFATGGSDTFFYGIRHTGSLEWEVGKGSLSDSTTLVRDTVLASSNSDALVDFSTGTKSIVNDLPAKFQLGFDIVEINSNTTITDVHNGKLILVDGTPTLTIDDALSPNVTFRISHKDSTAQAAIALEDNTDTLNGVTDGSCSVILGTPSSAVFFVLASGQFFIDGNITEVV